MKRRKINRCSECNEPLKHVQTNQWMCQQSPSKCKASAKIKFITMIEEEE
tara:strand:- start:369 stop:518 length:150 start_codon:yes stop_codon:yes gene_type:complete